MTTQTTAAGSTRLLQSQDSAKADSAAGKEPFPCVAVPQGREARICGETSYRVEQQNAEGAPADRKNDRCALKECDMSSTIENSALPAQIAHLAERLGLPDVTAYDLSALDIETKVELREELRAALVRASALFAEMTRPIAEVGNILSADIIAAIKANGDHKIAHDHFNVRLERQKQRVKRMDVLLGLRDVLPRDEFERTFKQTVTIKAHLDDAQLAKLRELLPGVRIDVAIDADGAVLNRIAGEGKDGYGPESVQGKIVKEGYVTEEVGQPVLVVEPRERAMKSVA